MGYSYKRLRFIPAKEPDTTLYEEKKSRLQKYDLLAQQGKIKRRDRKKFCVSYQK